MKAIYLTLSSAALLSLVSPGKGIASEEYYVAPKVFKVKTVELERCEMEEVSVNEAGEIIHRTFSVVTVKEVFSDGTRKFRKVTEPTGEPSNQNLREAKSYVAAPRG